MERRSANAAGQPILLQNVKRRMRAPASVVRTAARKFLGLLRAIKARVRAQTYVLSNLNDDIEAIAQSGLFDREWYLRKYPYIASAGMDPIEHYLRHGAAEGRDPSPDFSTWGYLETYPDVAAHRVNPFLHYVTVGRSEGRMLARKDYAAWIAEHDQLSDEDRAIFRAAIAKLASPPLISVLLPDYNADHDHLERAISSVLNQSYPNWELCISDDASTDPAMRTILQDAATRDARVKVTFRETNGHIAANSNSALALARGEFVALLDHDDELAEQALFWFALEIQDHPGADILYSDEDKINEQGTRYGPLFKPDWNPAMILAQNYVCHLSLYRRSLVEQVGGFRIGFEGSQDLDLLLRCAEKTRPENIRHIPRILYHWRAQAGSTAADEGLEAKPYAWDAGAKAIQDHLDRRGIAATVKSVIDQYYQVEYALPPVLPKVSIIIPTAWRLDFVRRCLTSVLRDTTYPDFEVIITSNRAHVHTPEQQKFVAAIEADPRVRLVLYDDEPFNYSRTNNQAVRLSDAPIICFLNDDVEVITEDWLEQLVTRVMLDGVGAVGPMLYFPRDTIQHAGVILGIGGVAGHQFANLPRGNSGYFGRAKLEQDLSCVTAACMAMRREVFDAVGGFDEDLVIAFNDVDLCIRVRRLGWRILWTPRVEMYHHESASLGRHDAPDRRSQFETEVNMMRVKWGDVLEADPFFNPNLSLATPFYTLAFPPRISKLPVARDVRQGEPETALKVS